MKCTDEARTERTIHGLVRDLKNNKGPVVSVLSALCPCHHGRRCPSRAPSGTPHPRRPASTLMKCTDKARTERTIHGPGRALKNNKSPVVSDLSALCPCHLERRCPSRAPSGTPHPRRPASTLMKCTDKARTERTIHGPGRGLKNNKSPAVSDLSVLCPCHLERRCHLARPSALHPRRASSRSWRRVKNSISGSHTVATQRFGASGVVLWIRRRSASQP